MSVYNKREVVAALSKLPTDVLIRLVHMYQESNKAALKLSDVSSTFQICNIPNDILEEIKEYESIEDSSLGQHTQKWVTTVKRLPKNTSALPVLDNNFLKHVDSVWNEKISGLEVIKEKLLPHFVQYLQTGVSRPIIFTGVPGCGKTRVMKTAGEILSLPVHIANAVQIATGNGLTGHSKTYTAAMPGEVVEGMVRLRSGNFVFGIDEVDKAHLIADRSGNFQNELLTLTSDETAQEFKDNFLGFSIDASHLFIIMTANEIDDISAPLQSRCDIIEFPEPDRQTIVSVLSDHTIPSLTKKLRCADKVLVDDRSVTYLVDRLYPSCKDMRKYQGIIESAINQAFLQSLRAGRQIVVDADAIRSFLNGTSIKQTTRIGF